MTPSRTVIGVHLDMVCQPSHPSPRSLGVGENHYLCTACVFNARYRSAAGSQTSDGHLVTLLHQAVGKVVDMTLHTPSARETKVADHQDAHARRGSYHQVAGADSVRLRACNVCQLVYEGGAASCHCQSFSELPRGREAAAVGSCRGCKGAFKIIQNIRQSCSHICSCARSSGNLTSALPAPAWPASMLPILLAVSAAGAVLELKRFVHRGGSSEAEFDDVQVQQEEILKDMLQVGLEEHIDCFAGASS